MAKFKITARVQDADGDHGEIMDKRKGERLIQYDNTDYGLIWLPKSELTALACPAVFESEYKVGDRVRFIRDNPNGGSAYGGVGQEFVVSSLDADTHEGEKQLDIDHPAHGFKPSVPLSAIEPVQPATWVPAVGKFGKTRDGHKVGPMSKNDGAYDLRYAFIAPHDAGLGAPAWMASGKYWLDGSVSESDLVAEWVEPEVAVVEATATPARKFKVGDVVSYVYHGPQTSWQNITITEDDGELYRATENGRDGAFYEDWLEPATPAAKFKVGDRCQYTGSPYPRPCVGTVSKVVGEKVYADDWSEGDSEGFIYADKLTLAPSLIPGTTVTFTATGRLSAINDNGHIQVTFPGLEPGQNSFALPARYVAAA